MQASGDVLIPTIAKAKIPCRLSYPAGAQQISVALRTVALFDQLRLNYYYLFDNALRWGHYEFIRVEYLNGVAPVVDGPITSLYQRGPQWRWEIVVQPVPRQLRHRIRTYIVEVALDRVARWLEDRRDFVQRGSAVLAFFYDEKQDEFVERQASHLEPLRQPKRSTAQIS